MKWDVGIIIYPKACNYYFEYPAFFTYLLGHARVCLVDESLHLFYCLIKDFIKLALEGEITKWYQLPHEILFDQYGLYICGCLYPRKEIKRQFEMMINLGERSNDGQLNKLLSLSLSTDLSKLREDLINFCLPCKEKLISLWKEDAKDATRANEPSITRLVNDYELLFRN